MMDAHSLTTRERRWRDLVEKNIGWIVIAASIWLTHFFEVGITPTRFHTKMIDSRALVGSDPIPVPDLKRRSLRKGSRDVNDWGNWTS